VNHPVADAIVVVFPLHQAETGGGPTGFGWGSFVVVLLGGVAVLGMSARLVAALRRTRRSRPDSRPEAGGSEGT